MRETRDAGKVVYTHHLTPTKEHKMNTNAATAAETVKAEEAPIGVQLWPTRSPEFAPNFTLAAVETVRNTYGTRVRWVYENGSERWFDLGEDVAVRFN
ncbi:hypothetical protein SEA_EMOTION_24 [Arthrobacter phage Emotion]|uniref:Uncharacterized protein n=1 Tax=Arthrobacter phage Emotion TaxID=3038361 RepID=A0AA49ILS5_9CAUD|nr:hypothetical protein SEA_EMOTION_24 [Arthrobacter phage Emotion]